LVRTLRERERAYHDIGQNKRLLHPEVLYEINSEEFRGPQAVANMFSDYFIGVGQFIVPAEIDFSFRNIHKYYFPPSEDTSIILAPVSFAEFHKDIKNVKSGNSVGYDGLSTKLLKNISGAISEPLLIHVSVQVCFPVDEKVSG